MTNHQNALLSLLLIVLQIAASWAEQKVYTVHLREQSRRKTYEEIEDHHHSFLHSVKGSREEAKASIVYSYKHVVNGFSALLSPDEAASLSEMEGVVSVFHSPPGTYKPQTTRSWDFMNLLEGNGDISYSGGEELLRKANFGKDVVVGVIDSGVWPESESFSDEGMDSVPSWWKGTCEPGVEFNTSHCNRKIIGARYFLKSFERRYGTVDEKFDRRSPRDVTGHGTHTASTIGGRRVQVNSPIKGGTASGGAPSVRLAIYKVCWQIPPEKRPDEEDDDACPHEDMVAAFEQAIRDGVQIISISISGKVGRPYFEDAIALGSLRAVENNIVVVASAGNLGPEPSTVKNVAPWIITVAASSTDRVFSAPVELGNGLTVQGQSVSSYSERRTFPLVYAGDVEIPGATTDQTSGLCQKGTLAPEQVQGRMVLCLKSSASRGFEVKRAGGLAAILRNQYEGNETKVSDHVLPQATVLQNDVDLIRNYIRDTPNPVATLIPAKAIVGDAPAPVISPFSSTGPSLYEPNILKPDITAPGFNILAAWSEASPPTNLIEDNRVVKYHIISGTSMSCPHVSAAASLLKAIHPDWSSAAIRSALMTTARVHNNKGTLITDAMGYVVTPFQLGAGHLQPSRASDPGLIYNASYTDYLQFLCSRSDYKQSDLLVFNCPSNNPSERNINYPSLAIANLTGSVAVKRSVTNVGDSNSAEYSVTIGPPPGYSVEISPTTLRFSQAGEEQSFEIRVTAQSNARKNEFAFGWYMWSDGKHQVRSPVAVSSSPP